MKHPNELTHEELVSLVEEIQAFMWPGGKSREPMKWSGDQPEVDVEILADVSSCLVDYGLGPEVEKP